MSHKFFTWTKGDRRNGVEALRSGEEPSECIAIQGLDGARINRVGPEQSRLWPKLTLRKSKPQRKPLPLDLGKSPDSPSRHSARTSDSIALQSAAVQSATSLLAVVNEVLRSPHIAGHLSAQQYCALPPTYGRPRARTAPSTPLFEAPFVEPVELPGSLIAGNVSPVLCRRSFDGDNEPTVDPTRNAQIGPTIVRPQTSPHRYTFNFARHQELSSDNLIPHSSLAPPAQVSPRSTSVSPRPPCSRPEAISVPYSSEDTLVAAEHDNPTLGTQRPSLSILQSWPAKSATRADSMATSRTNSAQTNLQHTSAPAEERASQSQHAPAPAADSDAGLLQQLALMRARHEAHVSSLKEAHEKEMGSHLTYISLLEKRIVGPLINPATLQRQLTLDTSHGAPRAIEAPSADASATTIHSSEVSFNSQKRSSEGVVAETEALKRKLSLCQKAVAEAGDVRRERDHLREVTDRNERRIVQLKDIVRKAKDQEKTLKNAVADLEARLVNANNERTDVLEGFHEACEAANKSTQREAVMKAQIEELQKKLFYTGGRHASDTKLALANKNSSRRPRHSRQVSDVGTTAAGRSTTIEQFVELRQPINEREAKIEVLEQQVAQTESSTMHVNDDPATGERCFKELQERLEKAEADRERYNALLHSELRRQSRTASQSTPHLMNEIVIEANAKLQSVKARSLSDTSGKPSDALERELKHYLNEIVLYKLDIKGYKKDLKKARAEIEDLKAVAANAPPTPDRDSVNSSGSSKGHRSNESGDSTFDATTSGLGINLRIHPTTPVRAKVSKIESALVPTPLRTSSRSPSVRPSRNHLASHKQLPTPPPRTPSTILPTAQGLPPPPQPPTTTVAHLQRAQTSRSISDSIISSYAKRTPEQQHQQQVPAGQSAITAGNSPVMAGQPPTPSTSRAVGARTTVFDPLRSHPVIEVGGPAA